MKRYECWPAREGQCAKEPDGAARTQATQPQQAVNPPCSPGTVAERQWRYATPEMSLAYVAKVKAEQRAMKGVA